MQSDLQIDKTRETVVFDKTNSEVVHVIFWFTTYTENMNMPYDDVQSLTHDTYR